MPTTSPSPNTAETATSRWRAAIENHNLDALAAELTPDAALHSPITIRIPFEGRKRVLELFEEIFDLLGPMQVLREVHDGDVALLEIKAELAGQHVHQVQRLELDADGHVADITLFMRPLASVANLAAHLGPRLARRRYGPLVAFGVAIFIKPVAALVRLADRMSPRFV